MPRVASCYEANRDLEKWDVSFVGLRICHAGQLQIEPMIRSTRDASRQLAN